jgi:hypothetical protein
MSDREFECYRTRVDEGRECPSCHARTTGDAFFHDGEAYHCPLCRLRFSTWLRQRNYLDAKEAA